MASKIKVDQIEGSTGSTITIPTGQTFTVTDGIPVASGGTGLASFTAGDILYATGATTLTKLGKGTAEQVLAMNTGATAPDWGSVDLTVLPTITVAKGGTNISSFAAGDILYATGATTLTKLVKGSAADVLTMNSGATAPEWAAAAGGGNLGAVIQTTFETQTTDTTADSDIMTMASLTPASSSSRFLININLWVASSSNPNGGMILFRNATAISPTAATPYGSATGSFWSADEMFDGGGSTYGMENFVWSYIDSPATASAIVYKLSTKAIATMYYNRSAGAASDAMSVSTMIVSELLE